MALGTHFVSNIHKIRGKLEQQGSEIGIQSFAQRGVICQSYTHFDFANQAQLSGLWGFHGGRDDVVDDDDDADDDDDDDDDEDDDGGRVCLFGS